MVPEYLNQYDFISWNRDKLFDYKKKEVASYFDFYCIFFLFSERQWLKAKRTVSLVPGKCWDQMGYSAVKDEWATDMLAHNQQA